MQILRGFVFASMWPASGHRDSQLAQHFLTFTPYRLYANSFCSLFSIINMLMCLFVFYSHGGTDLFPSVRRISSYGCWYLATLPSSCGGQTYQAAPASVGAKPLLLLDVSYSFRWKYLLNRTSLSFTSLHFAWLGSVGIYLCFTLLYSALLN